MVLPSRSWLHPLALRLRHLHPCRASPAVVADGVEFFPFFSAVGL
uniref:Uncharacterized protein n=1 Tax=Arundo donax TaxID=35708 RepID=A0A0A9GWF4_ARUDO